MNPKIKTYVIMAGICFILCVADKCLGSLLCSSIKDNFLSLNVTLFSVFIALYVFISPFIYGIRFKDTEIQNTIINKCFTIILDGIKESILFFFIGIVCFIFCTSIYINKWPYLSLFLDFVLVYCLGMLCQNLIDHTKMVRTLSHETFRIENNIK